MRTRSTCTTERSIAWCGIHPDIVDLAGELTADDERRADGVGAHGVPPADEHRCRRRCRGAGDVGGVVIARDQRARTGARSRDRRMARRRLARSRFASRRPPQRLADRLARSDARAPTRLLPRRRAEPPRPPDPLAARVRIPTIRTRSSSAGWPRSVSRRPGHYGQALDAGLGAVGTNPDDVWGIHAVVHTYEMQGRVDEGIGFLSSDRTRWESGNLFTVHNWWHLALYHLEAGRPERALDIYDAEIHHGRSAGVPIEMLDASALLWRMLPRRCRLRRTGSPHSPMRGRRRSPATPGTPSTTCTPSSHSPALAGSTTCAGLDRRAVKRGSDRRQAATHE